MAERLTLEVDLPLHVATLRYFDAGGAFAAAATLAAGVPLPGPLAAAAGSRLTLAWLSPTETLVLCADGTRLEELAAQLAEVPGGQVVDLRGALTALRLEGAGGGDFLSRLGGFGTVPAAGEARRGRLADVPVLALSLRRGEIQLVVDRAYAPHLRDWVRSTREDFAPEC
jgi:heterotetrameric sarcosine oxidase gamma subunit